MTLFKAEGHQKIEKKKKTNGDGHDWERFTQIANTWRSNTLKLYASRFAYIESLFPGFLELSEKEKSLTFFKSASFVDAN